MVHAPLGQAGEDLVGRRHRVVVGVLEGHPHVPHCHPSGARGRDGAGHPVEQRLGVGHPSDDAALEVHHQQDRVLDVDRCDVLAHDAALYGASSPVQVGKASIHATIRPQSRARVPAWL